MPPADNAPPMSTKPQTSWFHGSPTRLTTLRAGSTVTPVLPLAKAFSHKPTELGIEVRESNGQRHVTITQNGTKPGFLYRVVVGAPTEDLEQHPSSNAAPGEEMLTTRELRLEFIQELPAQPGYEFSEPLQ